MTAQSTQQQAPAAAVPPTMLAAAGEASELDRLLQQERARVEQHRNALEPQNWQQAKEFADMVVESKMYPDKDGRSPTPGAVMVRVMTGRQLGFASTIAMSHVYEVYGRPGLSAQAKRALVRRHPDCLAFEMVESDNTHCVWRVHRRGGTEHLVKWTIDDAKTAQLVKKDSNWEKYPRRMLQARASSEAADLDFEDACMGLATVDELLDQVEPMAPPVGAAVAGAGAGGPAPRDWAKDTEEIRVKILALFDQGNSKAARELYNLFAQEAPEDWLNLLKKAYNDALASHKAKGGGPKDSPTATREGASAPPPAGQQTLGGGSDQKPPPNAGDAWEPPRR